MNGLKKCFAWSNVLIGTRKHQGLRLPEGPGTKLPLELMARHSLSSDYLGDLRISGRNSGSGSRRK